MNSIPLDSIEWDFRGIREDELEHAIFYEYLRSSQLPVREMLSQAPSGSALETFARRHAEFPAPWLKRRHRPSQKRPALQIDMFGDLEARAEALGLSWASSAYLHAGYYTYRMVVPFGELNQEETVAQFAKWLSAESKKRSQKPPGKASEPPWAKLRWLSAYRLVRDAHLTPGASTKRLLEAYAKKNPRPNCTADLLPTFTSWGKVITNAKKTLAEMELRFMKLANPPARPKLLPEPPAP